GSKKDPPWAGAARKTAARSPPGSRRQADQACSSVPPAGGRSLPRRRLRRRRRGVPLDGEAGASQGRGGQEKRAGVGVGDGFLPMANIGSGEIIFRPGRNRRRATEYFAALRTIWNPPGFRRGSVETGKAESSYRAGGVGGPAAAAGRSGRRAAFGRG